MDEFENELRVAFESGDLEEPVTPSSKRRKSDILKGLDLGSPKSRRSWNESKIFGSHFDCVIDDKENLTNLVVCKQCYATFNYTGTHNLRNHIELKHGVQLPAKEKQKMMEDALVEFCVTDARPFSLINGKGFISFLDAYSELIHLKNQTTTSSLILPNEKTISRKVFEVLKSKQPELNSIFDEMSESGFSISLDFSQKLGTDYCVMVAHYITKDCNKKVCQTNCHWGDYETIQKAVRNVAKQNFPECLRPHVENVSPSLVTFGQNAMRTEIDFEMEQYETACKNLGGHKLDLLKFWKENSMKIPHLSSISKHFLAIPSSSTSCERIFSRFSPLVYDYKRNRFDPHTISTLISLQSLFKDE